jgi:HSP20 family protein
MGTLTRWNDLGGAFDLMNELRRHFGLLLEEAGESPATPWALPAFGGYTLWPRVTWADKGDSYELTADVPGMTEKDVQVSVEHGLISITGERREHLPEGRKAEEVKFSRSFSLPPEIDPEKATANVRHGVLTVILPKAETTKPRKIPIRGE